MHAYYVTEKIVFLYKIFKIYSASISVFIIFEKITLG